MAVSWTAVPAEAPPSPRDCASEPTQLLLVEEEAPAAVALRRPGHGAPAAARRLLAAALLASAALAAARWRQRLIRRAEPVSAAPAAKIQQYDVMGMAVDAYRFVNNGKDPFGFQCPVSSLLDAGDATSVGGCCREYDELEIPYIFPECANTTNCTTCFSHSAPADINSRPLTGYAGVAWAAASAVLRKAKSADNFVESKVKDVFQHAVMDTDEADAISHAELEGGRMEATFHFGPVAKHMVDACPLTSDWVAHMLDDEDRNIYARLYKSASRRLAVVVFRGTEASSLKNWEVDANINAVPLPLGEGEPVALAHEGFVHSLERVLPRVRKWVEGYDAFLIDNIGAVPKGWEIVFAGHSLGGALALLAATSAETQGWSRRPTATVIFGAPRVANGVLDDWWQRHGLCSKLMRVNVYNDVIHWMPLKQDMGLMNIMGSVLKCLADARSCLRPAPSGDDMFSSRWQHVCAESEVLVPGGARGVNEKLEDFSAVGGVLSHFIDNCRYGYAPGILSGPFAARDDICGIGPALCSPA